MFDAVVVEEVDRGDRNFEGVMTVVEADRGDLLRNFCELQTKCRTAHTKVSAGLIHVVQMNKLGIKFEEQLMEND